MLFIRFDYLFSLDNVGRSLSLSILRYLSSLPYVRLWIRCLRSCSGWLLILLSFDRFLALLYCRACWCWFFRDYLPVGKIALLIKKCWQRPHYLFVRREELTQLFPELLYRNFIVKVADTYLMVGFISLGASHFLHFSVKFGYQILLDLRLYRLIHSETFITENGGWLTKIRCTKRSGNRSTKILLSGSSPSSNLNSWIRGDS